MAVRRVSIIAVCLGMFSWTGVGCATVRGPVDGAFVYLGSPGAQAVPEAQIGSLLDEIRDVGMRSVIVQATRWKSGADCERGSYAWVEGFPSKLRKVLDEARRRDMRVYVGLVSTLPACPDPEQGSNPQRTRDDVRAAMETFAALHYIEHPALAGWYIPDEPGLGWSRLYSYFSEITQVVRSISPGKPVLVSPYLDKADRSFSPADVAKLARKFQDSTGVDVQVWQDSVGAGAVDLGWKRRDSRGTLEEYFRELSRALGREHLWADNEIFTWGDPLLTGAGYRPAPITRIQQQFAATSKNFVSSRYVWLEQRQMGSIDPERAPESARLRAAFLAAFGIQGGLVIPRRYEWLTPPAGKYPDHGNQKLFDGRTGDPREPSQADWVGIPGGAIVEIELDRERPIDWVGVHLLGNKSQAIAFPDSLTVACDGELLGSWPQTLPRSDAEIVMSNTRALGASCRRLRVELRSSGAWTFVSELELISERKLH